MPGKDKGLVGVELCRDEVRAVYVRRSGARAEIVSASYVHMPEGGLEGGLVAYPTVVAVALRKLLDDLRVPAGTGAVIGIPDAGVTLRTLNVPPAPDEELAHIVAGEVEHYRILRTKGSHAFVTLDPPIKPAPGTPRAVLVAAAEDQIIRSVSAMAAEAGMRIVALEPVQFGYIRAAAACLGGESASMAVVVGEKGTDIAAFSRGSLFFYRHVEYGAEQLVPRANVRGGPNPFAAGDTETGLRFHEGTLDALAGEISRSIEYLSREFKEHAQFEKVHLSLEDLSLSGITAHLFERLALPVELLEVKSNGVIRGAESMPDSSRYIAAFGLAVRELAVAGAAVPRVDLYAADRELAESSVSRRNLTGSLLTAVAALAIGGVGYYLYSRTASDVEANAQKLFARADGLRTEADAATEKHESRERQIGQLSRFGVPATALVDSIAASLDAGVGLQNITVANDRTVLISAEATSEAAMLHTVEMVQRIPILQNVMVQSFTGRGPGTTGLTFTISAKTLTAADVKVVASALPAAPPPATSSPLEGAQ